MKMYSLRPGFDVNVIIVNIFAEFRISPKTTGNFENQTMGVTGQ